MIKKYVKYDDNKKVIEVAPYSKGSMINYNSVSNDKMLLSNGYSFEEIEFASDGNYYLKGFAPVKSLEEVKVEKTTEINTARDNAEQGGFEFKGNMYDSDTLSAQRLSMASQTAATSLTAGQPFEITWTTQDNKQVVLSAQDMIEIVPALAMHSNTQHQKASVLKEQVTNATTVEEVEAIQWA